MVRCVGKESGMGTERKASERETWQRSLGRKVGKTVLVLVLLAAFAQWYVPFKGQTLAGRRGYPQEDLNGEMVLLRERLDSQEKLSDPQEPSKGLIWPDGMRSSRPLILAPRPKRVLVVGCSCTWGLGVNDPDTFMWKLHELVPDTEFDNAGMNGYGSYRCLEAMRHYMQNKRYNAVIYCAIVDHKYRDTRWHDEYLGVGGRDGIPRTLSYSHYYYSLVGSLDAGHLPDLEYHELKPVFWPGDSCIYLISIAKTLWMHFWGAWCDWEWEKYEYYANTHAPEQITLRVRLIINDMNKYAISRGAKFVFVSLDGIVAEMREMQLLGGRNCRELVPSFPLLEAQYPQDFRTTEGLHTPKTKYDNGDHPVAKVHTYFARKIADFISCIDY